MVASDDFTPQTQTEKWEAQLTGLLNSPVNSWKPTHILVRQIKEISKEAGLEFVKRYKSGGRVWDCSFEDIKI